MLSERFSKYEPGRDWIVTDSVAEGEASVRVDFLLSNNRRNSVVILTADWRDDVIQAVGDALEAGRRGIGKGGRSAS